MVTFKLMRVINLVTRFVLVTASFAADADLISELGIDPDVSYRAVRQLESVDGSFSFVETRAPRKARMEMKMGGMEMVVISREDLGRSYTLMPRMNTYMERGLGASQQSQAEDFRVIEATHLGPETVNGLATQKYRGKFVLTSGGRGAGYYWVSTDGIAVKIDMIYASEGRAGQRIVMQLSDLVVGPQDPSAFEIPPGYQAMLGTFAPPAPGAAPAEQPVTDVAERTVAADDIVNETGHVVKQEVKAEVKFEAQRQVRKVFNTLFRR